MKYLLFTGFIVGGGVGFFVAGGVGFFVAGGRGVSVTRCLSSTKNIEVSSKAFHSMATESHMLFS